MTSSLHIGLVQLNTAWEDPAANIRQMDTLLEAQQHLDLVVLPEMWSTGFTMQTAEIAETAETAETVENTDTTDTAESDDPVKSNPGIALKWMIEKASAFHTHIAGSISVKDGDHFYNRFFCVGPRGEIHQYDKRHLFSYGKEDHHYTAGQQPLTFQLGDWRIRAIVCYDLRFPVWCRNTNHYDVLLVVANWPVARIHHWDALLRARAIENQCYVVGVNRIGTDGNQLDYNGHSAVYDMNGIALLEMNSSDVLASVTLDKETLTRFRAQYRFLQDQDPFSL